MAKVKISEYSTTNSSNTDINSINIDEGCAPSGINNAIREVMVHLKNWQTNASGDGATFASLVVQGTGSFTGAVTMSAGATLSGTNTLSGANIISGNINSSGSANTFSGGVVHSGTNTFSSSVIISGNINSSGSNTFSNSQVISGNINSSGTNTFSGGQVFSGNVTFSNTVIMSSTLNGTTIPTSKTLVDTNTSQTLTNKTISGSANTLTNISLTSAVTGTLPAANGGTGITSLGSGVATWLGTPSSSNLAAAITDETGSGALVFGTSPSLTTPKITTGINDSNTNELFLFTATASAVNEFTVANGATGTGPTLSATGGDTNVNVRIAPKGTGAVQELVSSTYYNVVSQYDVGTAADQVPLNQYLGANAYVDSEFQALDVGTGISTGTGTICKAHASKQGGLYTVRVLIDLTGLNSGGTANDIIGVNGAANCYIAQLPGQITVLGGRMTCLETPAGGDTDIDLYSATEGTGTEDAAVTGLTETLLINAGTQSAGTVTYLAADPGANHYLYLAGQSTSNATYTAGRFLIEIFGV